MIGQIKCIISCILCIDLFVLNFTVSHSLSLTNVIKSKKNQQQINRCENWQFQCKNGQCIGKPFICDGLKDCSDASDETNVQCRNESLLMKCDKLHFQCKYGACIEKKYKCDGLKQCIDGSDESLDMCNELNDINDKSSERIRIRRDSTNKWCPAPASSIDKTVDFLCNGKSCQPSNGYVPEFTVATITCADDFYKETMEETMEESQSHICHNKRWLPRITKCLKKCEKLNPVNSILQCHRNGVNMHNNCEENLMLLAGTKVRPSCKSTYKYDSPPSYLEITCGKDGKWDNVLLPCVPECGKSYTPPQLTIAGGKPEKIGGSPWHVAIFEKATQTLICGGTIISEHLILSAAHCFSEGDKKCEGTDCVDNYEVIIGKYTSNRTVQDNAYQRTMKIKEIRFSKKGYLDLLTFYASDVVILILRDPIPISAAVLPACINWIDVKDRKYPSEGEPGKLVGWGRTENHTYSTILRTVSLPFIGYRRCVDMMERDFKRFVTLDKFCAGTGNESETGPTALDGDSGGGLLFEEKGLFYLRGIVSVKSPSSNSVTLFTDLTDHIDWIASVRDIVEKKIQLNNDTDFTTICPMCDDDVENTKKVSGDDIVVNIESEQFSEAEEKFKQAKKELHLYKYVIHKVYNNRAGNFNVLQRYGNFTKDVGSKFKIYDVLYNEMKDNNHLDVSKLILLRKSIENEILRPQGGIKAAESLRDILTKMIEEKSVSSIIANVVNNESPISPDFEGCFQCVVDIYEQAIEKLWDKLSTEEIFAKMRNKLNNLDAKVAFDVAMFHKLFHKNQLNTNKTLKLALHMKSTTTDPSYNFLTFEIRCQHEVIKSRLPVSVKSIVFSNEVCVKNVANNEYLYIANNTIGSLRRRPHVLTNKDFPSRSTYRWIVTSVINENGANNEYLYVANDGLDILRRPALTGQNTDFPLGSTYRWVVSFLSENRIKLLNSHYDELLHGDYFLYFIHPPGTAYDGEKRYVFTWIPRSHNHENDGSNNTWDQWNIEVTEDGMYVQNQYEKQYLDVDPSTKYLFTYRSGIKPTKAKWEFTECSIKGPESFTC